MTTVNQALVSVVKYFRPKSSHSDDLLLSAVHFRLAFGLIFVSGILSGLNGWFAPIQCMKAETKEIEVNLINQWCYANSTFVVDNPYGEFTSPVSPGVQNTHSSPFNTTVRLTYYQWVTLVLLLQATSFQIPRLLWKYLEGGRLHSMAMFVKGLEFAAADQRTERVEALANHFVLTIKQRKHPAYFTKFAICQALYLMNIVLQIVFTEAFLKGRFITLVPRWLAGQPELDWVFPKLAKCLFKNYGASGGDQNINVVCVLAMNVLIEKIYLVMWVIFAMALIVSIIQVIVVIAFLISARFRYVFVDEEDCDIRRPADLLLLRFFKDSVDPFVYDEFLTTVKYELGQTSLRI